jgi:hypothetical protein
MAHVSMKAIFVTSLLVGLFAAKGKLQSSLQVCGGTVHVAL